MVTTSLERAPPNIPVKNSLARKMKSAYLHEEFVYRIWKNRAFSINVVRTAYWYFPQFLFIRDHGALISFI